MKSAGAQSNEQHLTGLRAELRALHLTSQLDSSLPHLGPRLGAGQGAAGPASC